MNERAVFNTHEFDARGIAKRFRHAAIFGALQSLEDGETMRFVNDHDPLPLLQQIGQRYGNQIGIAYVARDAGHIVIDFTIQVNTPEIVTQQPPLEVVEGCGGGGGGCNCSGRL